jgi:hypothetical protein
VLDPYLFDSLDEVCSLSQQWQWRYNNARPHASLDNKTPIAFLLECGKRSLQQPGEAFSTFQQEDDDGRFSDFNSS